MMNLTLTYMGIKVMRDLPGGPVVKTLHSQFRGPWFDPWFRELDPACPNEDPACPNKDPACRN